jgi:hypothetical protein
MQQETAGNNQKINLFFFHYFKWLNVLCAILLLSLGGMYILKPKYNIVITDTLNKLEELQIDLEARNAYLNKLLELQRIYEKVDSGDKDKINNILTKGPNKEALMRQIEAIVKNNGSLLNSLMIESEKDALPAAEAAKGAIPAAVRANASEVGTIHIKLDVSSVNYAVLKRLLATFENNIRLMDLEDLSFNPSGMSANIALKTYYLK